MQTKFVEKTHQDRAVHSTPFHSPYRGKYAVNYTGNDQERKDCYKLIWMLLQMEEEERKELKNREEPNKHGSDSWRWESMV